MAKSKKRYGYKPKAVNISGLSAATILEMMKNPLIGLKRIAFGKNIGDIVAGGNVPWAGATAGATNTTEALSRLENVMSTDQMANIREFIKNTSSRTGTHPVFYPETGRLSKIPNAAWDRMSDKKKMALGIAVAE